MENWEQWENFLKSIAIDYKLTSAEQEFFFRRFERINLEKDDKEICCLVMGDENEEAYKKRKSQVYRKFQTIINHSGKNKFPILLEWLETEYKNRYTQQQNYNTSTEFPQKVSNPFIPLNGIIDNPKFFFNREREINRIFEVLNSGSSIAIIGESGVGKSSMLKAIAQKASQYLKKTRKPIYIDLQNIHSDDDFYAELCEQIGIKISRGRNLKLNIKPYRILLLLDVVENMIYDWFTNKLRSQLRGLANDVDPPLRLVVAASKPLDILFPDSGDQTSPFKNICIEEYLESWNQETIRDFIKSKLQADFLEPEYQGIEFSEDEISDIIKTSDGYPGKVKHQCYELFERKKL
ncbi:MAG: ATP-binding protein [Okeania sp. SIO2F4]|uniref:nSTAND1 domain-containing NTPase n=1 Tax=Okeania sp. SIO2F4 TaxID=2607790 RepID=UPI00142A5807|nr:AAA family ATPase [Okeania sp. SIO2F4]NES03077.1 ATP-binding protein [Okeania sp. SIO2F4]